MQGTGNAACLQLLLNVTECLEFHVLLTNVTEKPKQKLPSAQNPDNRVFI